MTVTLLSLDWLSYSVKCLCPRYCQWQYTILCAGMLTGKLRKTTNWVFKKNCVLVFVPENVTQRKIIWWKSFPNLFFCCCFFPLPHSNVCVLFNCVSQSEIAVKFCLTLCLKQLLLSGVLSQILNTEAIPGQCQGCFIWKQAAFSVVRLWNPSCFRSLACFAFTFP